MSKLNHKIIKDLYVRRKQSIKSIPKDFQVTRHAIQYALDKMNVKRRVTINHPLKGIYESITR